MAEYYTNESAAHLLLSMTRIVEKPEDCEGLRKCLNEVADVWEHLSQLERALVALVADHAASAEYWD